MLILVLKCGAKTLDLPTGAWPLDLIHSGRLRGKPLKRQITQKIFTS